jgi:hypothetical protein
LSFYEVVKTIRRHPAQTPCITLTLSINAIHNHNDIIDFQYFAEKWSLLPPVNEIQCWKTSSCKTPFSVVIPWSGENHQVASCANSMNNINPIRPCNQKSQ